MQLKLASSYILIHLVCQSVTVDQHGRVRHERGSSSSTTSLGIQWMDGASVGAESLWPSVIRWKPMFRAIGKIYIMSFDHCEKLQEEMDSQCLNR